MVAVAALTAIPAAAEPYVPASGDTVVAVIPSSLATLFASDQVTQPVTMQAAVMRARTLIQSGQRSGDPRFFGYASATLAPWTDAAATPTPVRLLQAMILQHQHCFDEALAQLKRVLVEQPANAQAWLIQAGILTVTGQYTEARHSCQTLSAMTTPLVATTCFAAIDSVTGANEQAMQALKTALSKRDARAADATVRVWALTLYAEIAAWSNRTDLAAAAFRQGLWLSPDDAYLLTAYSDYLIERGRYQEVLSLLDRDPATDALMLRRIIAERHTADADYEKHRDDYRERLAEARRWNSSLHDREYARFLLAVENQPAEALTLAQRNWQTQKEPLDTRIYLQAAQATGDRRAVQTVLAWLKQNDQRYAWPELGEQP